MDNVTPKLGGQFEEGAAPWQAGAQSQLGGQSGTQLSTPRPPRPACHA